MSNIRAGVQNHPGKDSKLSQWTSLKNTKESINVGLLTVFFTHFTVRPVYKDLPYTHSYYSSDVIDKQLNDSTVPVFSLFHLYKNVKFLR